MPLLMKTHKTNKLINIMARYTLKRKYFSGKNSGDVSLHDLKKMSDEDILDLNKKRTLSKTARAGLTVAGAVGGGLLGDGISRATKVQGVKPLLIGPSLKLRTIGALGTSLAANSIAGEVRRNQKRDRKFNKELEKAQHRIYKKENKEFKNL